jgi:hypothetical protein
MDPMSPENVEKTGDSRAEFSRGDSPRTARHEDATDSTKVPGHGPIRVSVPFRICAPSELVHGLSSTCLIGMWQGALTDAREQGPRR